MRHVASACASARFGAATGESGANASALEAALVQVITQWRRLCTQLMRTTLISHGNFLLSPFVGLILCAPKYLVDTMTLGEVTQAAAAFVTVQAAFNWLVDNYPRLADWRSSVHRVAALLVSLDAVDGRREAAHSVRNPGFRLRESGGKE